MLIPNVFLPSDSLFPAKVLTDHSESKGDLPPNMSHPRVQVLGGFCH